MKIYKIKVNGKTYKVELEAIEEYKDKPGEKKAAHVIEASKVAKAPTPVIMAEGTPILAPIQGKLIKFVVKPGDIVKKGDILLYIEAMKLENEVCAPRDGTVGELTASVGQNVNAKDVLLILK